MQFAERPQQILEKLWAHYLEGIWNVVIIFWDFQGFLIYLARSFWSLSNSSKLTTIFRKSNVSKTELVSFQYREISMVEAAIVCKTNFCLMKAKSKKKRLALTSFYYLNRKIWLDDQWKLFCIDQSRLLNFPHPGKSKNV